MTRHERLKLWLYSQRPVACVKPGTAFQTAPGGRRLRLLRHEEGFSVAARDDGSEVQVRADVLVSSIHLQA